MKIKKSKNGLVIILLMLIVTLTIFAIYYTHEVFFWGTEKDLTIFPVLTTSPTFSPN
jgi:hypothetical protein